MEQPAIDAPSGIILGHNQFFGISHLSSQRAAEREQAFRDVNNILSIVRYAREHGATGLMLSTHERVNAVADGMRSDPDLRCMEVHVLVPYMAKYVRAANTKGMLGMLSDILSQTTWSSRVRLGLTSGKALVSGDHLEKLKALIDVEMLPFRDLNVRSIYLHNALTDLAAGLGMPEILAFFCGYVQERYGALPSFCSLSSSLLMRRLADWKIEAPIMAPFNPVGFQMNPSREVCEADLARFRFPVVAMSPLAAGYVSPDRAAKYLESLERIGAVVVGASKQGHISETFALFRKSLERVD
jgi:hypothetical protein